MLRWSSSTSPIWRPTSRTGFSDDCGCWKIMLIRSPRSLRISSRLDLQQVLAVEDDLAALDAAGRSDQAHDRERGHALAAAGLADEAHDLAAVDLEVDPVDRPDDAVARVERRPQAADLEQRAGRRARTWRRRADAGTSSSTIVAVEARSSVGRARCSSMVGRSLTGSAAGRGRRGGRRRAG